MSRRAFVGALAAALVLPWTTAEAGVLTPREIYRDYGKAVVLVFATDGSAQGSAGTGSIITKDGQIITNAHVVTKDGKPYSKLFVYLKPDKLKGSMKDDLQHRYKATLVDIDHQLDLALLRMVDAPADLTTMEFADPDGVEIGEPVVAIGHPETGGLWTLTTGSISSLVADFQGIDGKDVFQTEASVNRGNSGGPLINAYGHMVGINTCISRKAADGLAITAINFSLKSSVAVNWLKRRKLMNLAYAVPNTAEKPVGAIAQAPTKQPEKAAPAPQKQEQLIAVVEPGDDEVVAEDPEFNKAAETQVVSRGVTAPVGQSGKGKGGKAPAQPKKAEAVQPKHLTKNRPYAMDDFVSERVAEIRALENMMDDARKAIDRKRGTPGKKRPGDGMGIW